MAKKPTNETPTNDDTHDDTPPPSSDDTPNVYDGPHEEVSIELASGAFVTVRRGESIPNA